MKIFLDKFNFVNFGYKSLLNKLISSFNLVELDLLSIKVERDVESNTSIITDYLSSLGLEKGKKICKLLPDIHSIRKANTATTMFENLN